MKTVSVRVIRSDECDSPTFLPALVENFHAAGRYVKGWYGGSGPGVGHYAIIGNLVKVELAEDGLYALCEVNDAWAEKLPVATVTPEIAWESTGGQRIITGARLLGLKVRERAEAQAADPVPAGPAGSTSS